MCGLGAAAARGQVCRQELWALDAHAAGHADAGFGAFLCFLSVCILCVPAGSAVFFAHSTVIYTYEKAYLPTWLAKSWPWWALKVFLTKQVCRARHSTAQRSTPTTTAMHTAAVSCWHAGEAGREGLAVLAFDEQ